MKKTLLLLALGTAAHLHAQQPIRCFSKEAIDYQEQHHPGYKAVVDNQFQLAKEWSEQNAPRRNTYTIPVVFHVVYNSAAENIPDSVIYNQLQRLNEDYARLNADTSNMRSEFDPVAGATQIQFMLAQIDPNGDPTSGITRTSTNTTSFGSFNIFFGDFTELEKVKSTSNGGIDPWDQTHYLNIWVCDMSVNGQTMLLGYASPPAGLPNWPVGSIPDISDGVVLQYQCVGGNNPNSLGIPNYDVLGRTATHEVGHYLGLRHIWGDGDCTMDDGINDTPDATDASQQDCNLNSNTCNADVDGHGDLSDMVENYMDYSAETCQNSFTQGQAALMHGVLENQRYDLVHNNAAGLNELTPVVVAFPNPASQQVTIESGMAIQQLQLLDLNGKIVRDQAASMSIETMTLEGVQKGIYILQVTLANNSIAQQRIVKH